MSTLSIQPNTFYDPPNTITLHATNKEVLRITPDGRLVTGEGLSAEEATQQAAKLLIASFEGEIQKMVETRIAAACEVEHALRAEVERLKELLRIESASAQHALAAAERAEADTARLDWLLDRSAQTYHSYSNHLGGGNYVQYHKDRAAIDAAMKEGSK